MATDRDQTYGEYAGYPVLLTKTEARLLIGMATNPEYQRFADYAETIAPLIEKLRAVL